METVTLLGRKQVSDYLHIAVNTEDLETDVGRIYTKEDIKQYIEKKYGFKVHSAYIGQVREKLGFGSMRTTTIPVPAPESLPFAQRKRRQQL